MKRMYLAIGSLMVLLFLAAAACSLTGRTPAPPEVTGPAVPTETVAPTVPPTAETEAAPPPQVASDALEHLSSYRMHVSIQQTVEGEAPQSFTMEMEETREPRATRILLTGEEEGGALEIVQIGDMTWMCSAEGECIQTQQSAEDTVRAFGEGAFINPTDIFDWEKYEYVGRDTVNGIRSRHYVVTVSPSELAGITEGTVTEAKADVWVADEAGESAYVTRFILSWAGTREDGKRISGTWSYEVYDVNKPLTIQPPAGAQAMPEDIPACSGATSRTMMGNTLVFSCPDGPESVAEFYRTEMPRQGWTAGEESTLGNMVVQEWSKGDRKVSLTIMASDEGGCSVMVSIE